MARKPKSVYLKIEEKQQEINDCEQKLNRLRLELKDLQKEKDNLEMVLLLEKMKERGLDINDALKALN